MPSPPSTTTTAGPKMPACRSPVPLAARLSCLPAGHLTAQRTPGRRPARHEHPGFVVQVGLHHVTDPGPALGSHGQDPADIALRIHDHGTRPSVAMWLRSPSEGGSAAKLPIYSIGIIVYTQGMPGLNPPEDRGPVIAVVGGGASGTLVALHLLRSAAAQQCPLRVALIDRHGRHGLGQAYGTTHPDHLLNAPAAQMSALAGDQII